MSKRVVDQEFDFSICDYMYGKFSRFLDQLNNLEVSSDAEIKPGNYDDEFVIVSYRDENEEEKRKRLDKLARARKKKLKEQEAKEERERKEYERLRKKFENEQND